MVAFSKTYEQPSAVNKIHLMKKLFNLKMAKGCSFMSRFSEFNMIVDQLTLVGILFDNEVQALLILSQLPKSWQGSVTAVSNSIGKEKLKLSEVMSLVLTKEIRRKSIKSGSFSLGSALNVEQRSRIQKNDY